MNSYYFKAAFQYQHRVCFAGALVAGSDGSRGGSREAGEIAGAISAKHPPQAGNSPTALILTGRGSGPAGRRAAYPCGDAADVRVLRAPRSGWDPSAPEV